MRNSEKILSDLFLRYFGEKPESISAVPPSGSHRRYYRLKSRNNQAVGTFGDNVRENRAFFSYTRNFRNLGLYVPELYLIAEDEQHYLQENVGHTALYDLLPDREEPFSEELIDLYKKSLTQLARMQIIGGRDLDYSVAFPHRSFDRTSMLRDCNYFRYYFLQPSGIAFDEQKIEEDFQKLSGWLAAADNDFFLFRDFQSRNIIINDGQPYFIDYQGGRRGALQYDAASLLWQAKANIPQNLRENLLSHYLDAVESLTKTDRKNFTEYYYGFVLMRQMQTLGAYGLRGLIERKAHFLQSIPFALKNIAWVLQNRKPPVDLPELERILLALAASERFAGYDKSQSAQKALVVTVQSFSYKKGGIPPDPSGNGGGFLFDCRFLHNPGRYQPYKKLTGLDSEVINFLKADSTIDAFLQNCYRITDEAVENYLYRDFASLMISFGCTGGQHRSVYAAEATAKHLRDKYGVQIILRHRERGNWPIPKKSPIP